MDFDQLIYEVGKELYDQVSLGFLDINDSKEVLDTAASLVRERLADKVVISKNHPLDNFSMLVGACLQASKGALSVHYSGIGDE